ncbi:hypothetical protein, partial [Pseudomonas gingeri]|uniref:hypothetical protein n=1 Tax=Pseudomonas gingeri TaxID=117681 RepID=UPI001ADF8560
GTLLYHGFWLLSILSQHPISLILDNAERLRKWDLEYATVPVGAGLAREAFSSLGLIADKLCSYRGRVRFNRLALASW